MTTNKFATETYVKTNNKTGTYVGTGVAFDIQAGFEPKMMQVIEEDTGEIVFKNKQRINSSCILRRSFGIGQFLKSYILQQNGITFGTDKVTIGTSIYVNKDGTNYTYIIWG